MQGGKDQVPGERRPDGDLRRFQIADLADHDDVRVLAQDRPQALRVGQPGFGMNLRLADQRERVLHRIFHGHDVDVFLVQALEQGVERRGLSRSRRARREDDAIRQADHGLERLGFLLVEAQVFQPHPQGAAIQDSQHDVLAEHRGLRRDPHVDLLVGHLDEHAPVLREAALRDVQLGHDLQP